MSVFMLFDTVMNMILKHNKLVYSRVFLLCRHTRVCQREKCPNVRKILCFRHIGLLYQKACVQKRKKLSFILFMI